MVLIWLLAEMSSPAVCCPPKLSALIWANCPVKLNNQTCNNLTQPGMRLCTGVRPLHISFHSFSPAAKSKCCASQRRMETGGCMINFWLDYLASDFVHLTFFFFPRINSYGIAISKCIFAICWSQNFSSGASKTDTEDHIKAVTYKTLLWYANDLKF